MKYIEEALSKPIPENTPEHELSVIQRLAKTDKDIALSMVIDMFTAGIDTVNWFLLTSQVLRFCLEKHK